MPDSSRTAIVPWLVAALVVGIAGGGYLWKREHPSVPPIAPSPRVEASPPAPPPPSVAATPPRILHPIAPAAPAKRDRLPALDEADAYFRDALVELLGRKAVQAFVTLDGFARRSVATVNNLATDNAAAELWPIKPTAGRLVTEASSAGTGAIVIGARNADRYAAFVQVVEAIDARRAVELYVRAYPVLQRAYEEIGFPEQYLNDRVIAVIDNLLATPALTGPIRIKPVEVAGDERPASAPHLYVFEDPALEASTAGQKILLRMGPENARRLEAKLSDLRRRLLDQAPAPSPVGKQP